jgi:parvulin-like peptidyl-prolyl isomerase
MNRISLIGLSSLASFFSIAVSGQTPPPKPAAPAKPKVTVTAPKPAAAPAAAKPAAAAAAKPAPTPAAASADPIVLNIGSLKVTKKEYEEFISALPPQIQAEANGPNKRKVAEQYAELRLMAEEARKRKIDQTPAVKAQLAFQLDQALASILFRELQNEVKIDDAALQTYYDAHKGEYEQVKAKHILIRFTGSRVPVREGMKEISDSEALAKAAEIKKKLEAGGDFAALAKAESDDTGTGAQGGDLGSFGRGQMVPEFETAAFAQPIGKVGDPVRSAFGYHLIVVDSRNAKSMADMKGEIEKALRPDLAKKEIESIKKVNVISVDEGYFGK